MDKDLFNFLHNGTDLRRLQSAEVESIFAAMEDAGWRIFKTGDLSHGEATDALAKAKEHKAAIAHNMKPEPEHPVHQLDRPQFENAGPAMRVPPPAMQGSIPGALAAPKRADPVPPSHEGDDDEDAAKPHKTPKGHK